MRFFLSLLILVFVVTGLALTPAKGQDASDDSNIDDPNIIQWYDPVGWKPGPNGTYGYITYYFARVGGELKHHYLVYYPDAKSKEHRDYYYVYNPAKEKNGFWCRVLKDRNSPNGSVRWQVIPTEKRGGSDTQTIGKATGVGIFPEKFKRPPVPISVGPEVVEKMLEPPDFPDNLMPTGAQDQSQETGGSNNQNNPTDARSGDSTSQTSPSNESVDAKGNSPTNPQNNTDTKKSNPNSGTASENRASNKVGDPKND